ncbi:MAG: hypothetical protein A3E78_08920 [Alphaproteobacteria bacterium RIFCSPHIGHO2_12_FULL_63_12]|nr:MAG: hypothetical protein A3E78_08920 [Alphaproteobacteria bacterium RIFCSPHIGHO2_12_FULL_63_12]
MGLTLLILATCILFGGIAYFAARGPLPLPDIKAAIREAEPKRFSPRNTLFIIGPTANHNACRMQRRLLKPAIAALIREDVSVIEVYGQARPTKNGEQMEWLDASLLRHAMNADEGFFVIYVDADGKSLFRSEAPMLARDIIDRARLGVERGPGGAPPKKSLVLKKLRAA